MTFSRIIAEFGPSFIARELARARELNDAERIAFFETVAPDLLNGITDGLRAVEATKETDKKVRWVADAAVEMLRHHGGELMDCHVDDAVRLAKRIADQAEKMCTK